MKIKIGAKQFMMSKITTCEINLAPDLILAQLRALASS